MTDLNNQCFMGKTILKLKAIDLNATINPDMLICYVNILLYCNICNTASWIKPIFNQISKIKTKLLYIPINLKILVGIILYL